MVAQNHDLGDEFRTMYMVQNSRKHNTIANIYHKRNYNTATQIWGQLSQKATEMSS
jgi:hypothetical protein